jgi:hypothetical protein
MCKLGIAIDEAKDEAGSLERMNESLRRMHKTPHATHSKKLTDAKNRKTTQKLRRTLAWSMKSISEIAHGK